MRVMNEFFKGFFFKRVNVKKQLVKFYNNQMFNFYKGKLRIYFINLCLEMENEIYFLFIYNYFINFYLGSYDFKFVWFFRV